MISKEERKQRLRDRTQRGVDERDQTGLGKKTVLDYTKTNIKVIKTTLEAGKGKTRCIDIIPFAITQPWYKDLKSKSGTPTGLTNDGDWDYKLEIPVHKNVGPNNKSVLCLQNAFGRKCPLCEKLYAEWDKDESDQDQKKIDALKSSWRCYYNVYDYDGESGEIELLEDVSYFLFEDMLKEAMETDDEGVSVFWDLEEGKTLEYKTREKKLGKNPFHEVHSIKFLDREPYAESILEKAHPLDAMLIIPTEQDVLNAIGDEGQPNNKPDTDEASQGAPLQRQRPRRIGKESVPTQENEKRTKTLPAETVVCPHGGIFGKDCNSLAECDACEERVYAECQAAFVVLQNEGTKRERPTEPPPATEEAPTRRRRRNI